jgi:transcriptional regulator with XRE-family HTH domain
MFKTDRLRELRGSRGLTQAVLAARVGTTQGTLSRIEKGEIKERPDRGLAKRIAVALEVPLSEIFDDEEPGAVPAEAPPAAASNTSMGAYERDLLSAVDPAVHSISDLVSARAALVSMEELTGSPVELTLGTARRWLDAASEVRSMRLPQTAQSVTARYARGKDS